MRVPSLLVLALVVLDGCGGEEDGFPEDDAGPDGDADADADSDGDSDADVDADGDGDADTDCADDDTCSPGLRCVYDTCVPEVPCPGGDDCQNDSYCDTDDFCVPWGVPADRTGDATCSREAEVGPFEVALQCAWDTPPDDALPTYQQVGPGAMVADLDLDDDAGTFRPSIVFNSYLDTNDGFAIRSDGVLRVIDGRTCEHQASLIEAEDRTNPSAPPSIGDLDGDGRPEIVTPRSGGGVIAFTQDGAGGYVRLWISAVCDGEGGRVDDRTGVGQACSVFDCSAALGGVSIHDLDDDGTAEIVNGAVVLDAAGCVIDDAQGFRPHGFGQVPVLADPDLDGRIEWISGDTVLEWVDGHLEPDLTFTAQGGNGYVAVADFGEFPEAAGDGPGVAEIAVVADGSVRIQSVGGDILFGPFSPASLTTTGGYATGGPPTVADFDGDGAPEIATAGSLGYVVFDLECDADPLPGECEERGVRWSKATQDSSSRATGSSVFDFEGDGASEAIYADECYLRVFDGATGDVKWSTSRSSATWYEYPILADVDGDFATEIVVPLNDSLAQFIPACASPDPHFADATFVLEHGIHVYADAGDQWTGSRGIWNQHAYSVTNVGDDGSIPRTSEWLPNWSQPGLNNFRQNVQGGASPLAAVDLTVACAADASCVGGPQIPIDCSVCNRGALGIDAGVSVAFHAGAPGETEPFCTTTTAAALLPGTCTPAACAWDPASVEEPTDVHVAVDADGAATECNEGNNEAILPGLTCPALE